MRSYNECRKTTHNFTQLPKEKSVGWKFKILLFLSEVEHKGRLHQTTVHRLRVIYQNLIRLLVVVLETDTDTCFSRKGR